MSTKKKKPVHKTRPRTTYDVTLEHATARLEKAVEERTEALMALDKLSRQIPWLENLVKALTPVPEEPLGGALGPGPYPATLPSPDLVTATDVAAKEAAWKAEHPVRDAGGTVDQAQFLAQFLPRTSRSTTTAPPIRPVAPPAGTSPDPDEFLRDEGTGAEVLS